MRISEVKVTPVEGNNVVRALAEVRLGGRFLIKGIKIIKGWNGPSVVIPSRKIRDGVWWNPLSLLDEETGRSIRESVLKEYDFVSGR